MALLAQARRFQPHRAAAGPDVPHHARGPQLQPRQRNGTHFLLGDQPLVGLALRKRAVGLASQYRVGQGCLAPQQHHIGMGELAAGHLIHTQVAQHAFLRAGQAFGHRHAEIAGQPLDLQQARNAAGRVFGAGQHRQMHMASQLLRQRIHAVGGRGAAFPLAGIARMDGRQLHVRPRQPQPRTRQLDGRDIRHHIHRVHAQA